MAIVIGNISQFMTRYLSIDISAAHNWHAYIKLSKTDTVLGNEFVENQRKVFG